MKKESGFSIIESLVYCFLLCFMGILLFNWVGACQVLLRKTHKNSRNLLDTYAALDSFIQDAISAPNHTQAWEKISGTEIIWQTPTHAIGWNWQSGSLYRTTGNYGKNGWNKSTKNLISHNLKRVQFSVGITFTEVVQIACDMDAVHRSIKLRNRRKQYAS